MSFFYLNIREENGAVHRHLDGDRFATAQEARDAAVGALRSALLSNPDNFEFDHKEVEVEDNATGHPVAVTSTTSCRTCRTTDRAFQPFFQPRSFSIRS